MKPTKDFAEIIRQRLARDPELAEAVEEEFFNAEIAIQVYNARVEAGLTQTQLAERIDSHQPVIARLEDADYTGHSLSMLQRIAKALNKRLSVEFREDFHTPEEEPSTVEVDLQGLRWVVEEWDVKLEIPVKTSLMR